MHRPLYPQYPFDGRLVGPIAGLDDVEKIKFLIPSRLELRPLSRPGKIIVRRLVSRMMRLTLEFSIGVYRVFLYHYSFKWMSVTRVAFENETAVWKKYLYVIHGLVFVKVRFFFI
jgi:hypothetical protein